LGIIKHNDIFSTKYINLLISDGTDKWHVVWLKRTLGDFVIAKIDRKYYAFSLKNARILTRVIFGAKSIRIIEYDTSNFRSIDPRTKELEHLLTINNLPKMNRVQFELLKLVGQREKKMKSTIVDGKLKTEVRKIEPTNIEYLFDLLAKKKEEFPETALNAEEYLKSLDIKEIVTPTRNVTDFIQEDLIASNPSFFGDLVERVERINFAKGHITNTPVGVKWPWLKLVIILMIAVTIIAFVAYAATHHGFDFITNSFSGLSSIKPISLVPPTGGGAVDQCTDQYLQDHFTPEALKIAIDKGENTCKLSEFMQGLVDGVSLPQVIPSP